MTQDAVVVKNLNNGMAEVSVIRGTACGGNCGGCEACIYQNELRTLAVNTAGAKAGQRVELETKSSAIYKKEILIYIIPLLCLVAGYVLAAALGAGEGLSILCGFVLMLAVTAVIISIHRKSKASIQHEIVRVIT